MPLLALHGAEDLQAEAFVGREDAAVGFEFLERGHGHAKIDGGKWPAANDAIFPALRFSDFLNFLRRARVKGDEPFVTTEVAFGFVFSFEPFVTEQNANGTPAAGAESIERHSGVGLGKMMIDDFGGFGRVRRELSLNAELHAAGFTGVPLEAKIFVQNPKDVGGIFVLFEERFPGGECVFESRALVTGRFWHTEYLIRTCLDETSQ